MKRQVFPKEHICLLTPLAALFCRCLFPLDVYKRQAKDPSEVRAGDILRAVEGSTAPVACDGIDNSCTRSDLCSTVKFWRGLDDVIEKYVDGVTLADLAAVPEINFDIKL